MGQDKLNNSAGSGSSKSCRDSSSKKRRRRISTSSSDDETFIDQRVEEVLRTSAVRNNLSKDEVKNIIKKVCTNDHVLALVKLKEEELDRIEKFPIKPSVTSSEDDDELTIKLTRSKARELNKNPLPLPPLKIQSREITSLIHDDLASDEDDDEYQPGDEEPVSDDDINTTASDLDSQPRTPLNHNEDDNIVFTADGLFKIPRLRTESMNSAHTVEDYTIAKQTRSKVSLTETPIETIESNFQPPDDIPSTPNDRVIDHNYLEFLQDIFQPSLEGDQMNASNIEEDDDDDEDFVVFSKIPADREEMYNAPIPKKEYHDLLTELFGDLPDLNAFDCLNGRGDDLTTPEPPPLDPVVKPLDEAIQPLDETIQHLGVVIQPLSETNPPTTPQISNGPLEIQSIQFLSPSMVVSPSTLTNTINSGQLIVTSPIVNPLLYQSYITPVKTIPTIIPENITQDNNTSLPIIIIVDDLPKPPALVVPIEVIDISEETPIDEPVHPRPEETTVSAIPTVELNVAYRYQRRLYKRLETDLPIDYAFDEKLQGFCNWQIDILRQQLEQHVQFAAQNYIQTYAHPGDNYWQYAETFKEYLTELNNKIGNSSVLKVANLKDALDLVLKWQGDRSVVNDTNTEFLNYMEQESEKSMQRRKHRSKYIFQFHPLVMQTLLHSTVFMYPELLPHIPYRLDIQPKYRAIIPIEDYLIAFGLEHYYAERRARLTEFKVKDVESKLRLETVCKIIGMEMMPMYRSNRTQKCSIYTYVVRRRNQTNCFNPIQYFFKHKRAPPFRHVLMSITTICAPIDAIESKLPYCWANEVKRLKELRTHLQPSEHQQIEELERTQQRHRSSLIVPKQPLSAPTLDKRQTPNNPEAHQSQVIVQVLYDQLNSTAVSHAPAFDPNYSAIAHRTYDTSSEHSADLACDHTWDYALPKDQSLITSFFKKVQKPSSELLSESEDSASRKSSNITTKQFLRKQARIRMVQLAKRQSLVLVIAKCCHQYLSAFRHLQALFRRRNLFLLRILNCLTSIDIYLYLLVHLTMNGAAEKRPRQAESQNSATVIMGDEVSAKKMPRKSPLLLDETQEEIDEKDMAFAQNYLDRVEAVFAAEENNERFLQFEELLKTFDHSTEKASDLYLKIEAFFLPDHPDLAELFLAFLLPGEAAQIGKFMDHFLVTNMNNFINKLNIYFNKQPAQIRKIMTSLKDLADEETLTVDQIKTKILPLLKGNVLLIEWFQQCFPSDRVADFTNTKFESLNFHKATEAADDPDVYEYIPQSELVPDPAESPCHIRYINGNIYYGCRILLPAQLSFQVHSTTQESSQRMRTEMRDEMAAGNLSYHCVHDIKRAGDIKFREQLRVHLENEFHVTSNGGSADMGDSSHLSNSDDVATDESSMPPSVENTPIECCTDIMLKAHAIRLNPNAHSTDLIRTSDLLDLLRPSANVEKLPDTTRVSPKKQSHRALAGTFAAPTDVQRQPKASTDTASTVAKKSVTVSRPKATKKCMAPTPKTSDKPAVTDSVELCPKIEPSLDFVSDPQLWSREEDKILLEEIKNGFASFDALVQTLQQSEQLPNRSYGQIHDRFTFLMDIIVNL